MANRFLLVQLASLGDMILTTPALAALREAQPDAHLAMLTTAAGAAALDGTNLVNDIIVFDKYVFDSPKALLKPRNLPKAFKLAAQLRRGRYDTAIFFHHFSTRFGASKFAALAASAGSKRRIGLINPHSYFLTDGIPDKGFGALHQAQYWLNLVAILGANPAPRPAVIAKDLSLNPSPQAERDLRIAIHAGSGGYSLARRWDAVKFAAVADALHEEYGAEIVLVGGPDDDNAAVKSAMRSPALDLTAQTTLPQLAAVLAACDLFIGADSGVMHVAAAVGTPIVAIFGPSNHRAWGPWSPDGRSIIVRSAPECSPCSYVGYGVGLRDGCAARTCMRMVTVDDVLAAARTSLDNEAIVGATGQSPQPAPTSRSHERVRILDIPVDAVTYADWLALIEQWLNPSPSPLPASEEGFVHHVCTVNPEFIMVAQQDVNFHNILNRADLCIPDGVALLWAARRLGKTLPERVTGSDGVPKIAERAAERGWRLFFLGAAPGVAEQAAGVLRAEHPALQIVGTFSGSPAPEEEDQLVEMVNASDADILFVAFGAPEQDKWIARNTPRLRVKMAMGVGGTFDFIAGVVPRAPLWFREHGVEWLYRLYKQPWRIRRMMRLPRFVLAILTNRPTFD